jgi:hypothetical protein
MEHVEALAADMRVAVGLVLPCWSRSNGGDHPYLINGRHSCAAACLAGIPIQMFEVPWSTYIDDEDEGLDGEDMSAKYQMVTRVPQARHERLTNPPKPGTSGLTHTRAEHVQASGH